MPYRLSVGIHVKASIAPHPTEIGSETCWLLSWLVIYPWVIHRCYLAMVFDVDLRCTYLGVCLNSVVNSNYSQHRSLD